MMCKLGRRLDYFEKMSDLISLLAADGAELWATADCDQRDHAEIPGTRRYFLEVDGIRREPPARYLIDAAMACGLLIVASHSLFRPGFTRGPVKPLRLSITFATRGSDASH